MDRIVLGALAFEVYRQWMAVGGRRMLVDRERNRGFMITLMLGGWMASRILPNLAAFEQMTPDNSPSWFWRFGRTLDTEYYGPGYNLDYYRTLNIFRHSFASTLPAAVVAAATLAAARRYA